MMHINWNLVKRGKRGRQTYGVRTQAGHGHWNGDKDDPVPKQIHREIVLFKSPVFRSLFNRILSNDEQKTCGGYRLFFS